MKKLIQIIFFLVLTLSISVAQVPSVFENPILGISFQASSHWNRLDQGNTNVLELVNQNNNLRIRMWYDKTELNASAYLDDLLLKEGLSSPEKPFEITVDNKKAVGVVGICNEMHRPVKILLLAISYNDGLYLIRCKCPDECYREHLKQLDKLMSSVKWINRAESHLFYAEHSSSS